MKIFRRREPNFKLDRRTDDICISIRSSRSSFVASALADRPRSLIKLESQENQCIVSASVKIKENRVPTVSETHFTAIKCTGLLKWTKKLLRNGN